MAAKKQPQRLGPRRGWTLFLFCWVLTFLIVGVLRHLLIPKEEMDCYARVRAFQKAVDLWDQAHPDKAYKDTDEIDAGKLTVEGFLHPVDYDHDRHYYFVGKTAHGLKVKCNKDEDNPLLLRLTGVTLLSILVFLGVCVGKGYRIFD